MGAEVESAVTDNWVTDGKVRLERIGVLRSHISTLENQLLEYHGKLDRELADFKRSLFSTKTGDVDATLARGSGKRGRPKGSVISGGAKHSCLERLKAGPVISGNLITEFAGQHTPQAIYVALSELRKAGTVEKQGDTYVLVTNPADMWNVPLTGTAPQAISAQPGAAILDNSATTRERMLIALRDLTEGEPIQIVSYLQTLPLSTVAAQLEQMAKAGLVIRVGMKWRLTNLGVKEAP
jgi:hypothetical protein